jgi:hypothetical protein
VQVPRLLSAIQSLGNVSAITPAVQGATHGATSPKLFPAWNACVAHVPFIEIYATVFTNEGWRCFYHLLHHTGGGGWCYDLCFAHHCGRQTAVDYSMVAYHLGDPSGDGVAVPESAGGQGIVPPPDGSFVKHVNRGTTSAICERHKCPGFGNLWRDQHPWDPLSCLVTW